MEISEYKALTINDETPLNDLEQTAHPLKTEGKEVDSFIDVADVCGCFFLIDDDVCVADVFSLVVRLEFSHFEFLSRLVIT